jgi:hypothetical protein
MAWFYEICDAEGVVFQKTEGFRTQEAAMAAGRAEEERLNNTGNIPVSGWGTITAGQDSQTPRQ